MSENTDYIRAEIENCKRKVVNPWDAKGYDIGPHKAIRLGLLALCEIADWVEVSACWLQNIASEMRLSRKAGAVLTALEKSESDDG